MAMALGDNATVVLSGIGTELSDGMLMNMYRTYGPIVRVRHNGTNSAHVVFEQKNHALKAVEATNGAVVYGKTLKVSLQRQFKTTEPCRGFAAGICRKGDMCKYYHVTDNAAFAAAAPVVEKAPREKKKKTPKVAKPKIEAPTLTEPIVITPEIQSIPDKQVCRHFSRGYCSQGMACKFAHVLGGPKPAALTGKVAQLCQFFQSGVCTRGEECRFIHQPRAGAEPVTSSTTKASATKDSEAKPSATKPSKTKAEVESSSDEESEAEPEQNKENRTCAECEKPGVAVWECVKCDNSLYCDDCNSAVHRARVMAKHKRAKLPPVRKLLKCGECESKTASVRCEQCETPFCASCDASVHKFKSLRKHTRVKLSNKAEKATPKVKEPKKKESKATKKEEGKKNKGRVAEVAPQPKVVKPVPYVESVPQLEFSSDSESSESEDEEMEEASPITSSSTGDDDEPMPAADESSETESEEDFDDVKQSSSGSVTPTPAAKKQTSESSESESESDFEDKPTSKSTPPPASVPKMELSSDSDSSDDEEDTERTPAPAPVPKTTPTLAELSSESESDSDDKAPSKPVVKQTKKPEPKAASPESSSETSGNSDDSDDSDEDEAPSKPAATTKVTPAPKVVVKKAASSSSSSSSESSDSSDDETPPAKPTPAPRRAPAPARNNKAGGISEGSSHTLVKKIEAFNESGDDVELHLDANLNGFERLLAHDCAERLGLAHESTGSGLERHIIISRHGAKRPAADSSSGRKAKKSKHH